MCSAIKTNTTLKYLDISNNKLTGGCLLAIGEMLKSNKVLRVLYLEGN